MLPAETESRQQRVYQGTNPKLMFRYRAGGVGQSAGANVGTVGAATTLARGPANGAFVNFHYIPFTGAGVFKASATAPAQTGTGFTVIAHFKATDVTGNRRIYSDAEGGGIALEIVNGYVKLNWHDGTSYRSITASNYLLDTTRWHFVVAAVTVNPTTPSSSYARIYVDGLLRSNVTPIPGAQNLQNSNQVPCVGGECDGSGTARAPSGMYFVGQIGTVEMINYPLWSYTYRGNMLNDGGWYWGLPSYFDYTPPVSDTETGAYRSKYRGFGDALNQTGQYPEYDDMDPATGKVTERISLPYINDGIVWQGISMAQTTTANDTMYILGHRRYYSTDPDEGWVFVSDIDMTNVLAGTANTTIRKTYRLVSGGVPIVGHAMGVHRVGNNLWAATGDGLGRYDLTATNTVYFAADAATGRPLVEDMERASFYAGVCGGANLSYDAPANRLYCFWDGAQVIKGYNLNADGTLPDTTVDVQWTIPVAAGPFSSHTLQGGAAYRPSGATQPCFLLHFSAGQNGASRLWKFCPSVSPTTVTMLADKLSPGAEGVTVTSDGMVWGIQESTARYIQTGGTRSNVVSPWIWGMTRSIIGIQ